MIQLVADKRDELNRLCQKYNVRSLDMFGSAASGENFEPQSSDLDFLVDFQHAEKMNVADQYFGLWEDLKALFGCEIDLLTVRSLRNRYFIEAVNKTRQVLYAA